MEKLHSLCKLIDGGKFTGKHFKRLTTWMITFEMGNRKKITFNTSDTVWFQLEIMSRENQDIPHFVIHKVILLKSVDYINRLNKIYPFFCCNDHNFYFSIEKNDWQLTDNNGIYREFKSIKPLIDRLSLTINEWWRYKRKSLNIFAYGRKIWKWEDRIRGSIIAWSYQFDEIKFLYFFYISK